MLAFYIYDSLSRRSTITRGNSTGTGFGYDAASRLNAPSQDLPGTTHDASHGFSHTPAGQLRTRSTSNTALDWWTAPELVQSYVANGLNRYTSVNGTTFDYDPNGNLRSDGSRTFTYDVENRLTSVTGTQSLTLSLQLRRWSSGESYSSARCA